jgi:hypothetical protein
MGGVQGYVDHGGVYGGHGAYDYPYDSDDVLSDEDDFGDTDGRYWL